MRQDPVLSSGAVFLLGRVHQELVRDDCVRLELSSDGKSLGTIDAPLDAIP